jgi:hypothetical protein
MLGPRPRLSSAAPLGALLVAIAAGAGCARTTISTRAETGYVRGDLSGEMEFWYALPGRAAVSNDEGLHGLMLLENPEAPARTYEERVGYAKAQGWLPEGWEEPPELAIQRGRIASALVVITKLRGGVMMRLVGPVPRYALREVIYAGLMPPSSENQTISGDDFIAVISKAQDYMAIVAARGMPPEATGPAGGDGAR